MTITEPTSRPPAEVADGIWRVDVNVPFRGLRQVNMWLIRDGDGWTMVDCGWGDAPTRAAIEHAWDTVLGGKPVTRLIVTHFHPDHMGNCRWICERWKLRPETSQTEWLAAQLAVRSLYSDSIEQRLKFFRENGLSDELLETFSKGWLLYSNGVELADNYKRLKDGDFVACAGGDWRVIIGRGHSPEMVTLYSEARGIYISGDQMLPKITSNVSVFPWEPLADPLAEFLESAARIGREIADDVLILPSHRDPFRGARQRAAELEHHHAERLDLVRQILSKQGSVPAGQMLDELFNRKLDGHQVSFAMGEALAHLNFLVLRGEVQRTPGPDGVVRFTLSKS
ncbi:MAG: hypothetical protein RLZ98_2398 [Pseudomonadota bacterium]|jgi:glyoxylase-like metal-dependent hydrolase (beta-lactamase superfamily II)